MTRSGTRIGIKGYCPACGHQSLGVTALGLVSSAVRCFWDGCPRPSAAAEILDETETEHQVMIDDRGFMTLRHPLKERLGDELMQCQVPEQMAASSEKYLPPGRYRVTRHTPEWGGGTSLVFEPLTGPGATGPLEGDQDVYPGS